jgi:hypothetical protein
MTYIARNPVEAGLCADPSDWEWSDYEAARRACEGSDPGSDPYFERPELGLRREDVAQA